MITLPRKNGGKITVWSIFQLSRQSSFWMSTKRPNCFPTKQFISGKFGLYLFLKNEPSSPRTHSVDGVVIFPLKNNIAKSGMNLFGFDIKFDNLRKSNVKECSRNLQIMIELLEHSVLQIFFHPTHTKFSSKVIKMNNKNSTNWYNVSIFNEKNCQYMFGESSLK